MPREAFAGGDDMSLKRYSRTGLSIKFATVALASQPGSSDHVNFYRLCQSIAITAEQIMYPHMQITADSRFLEFNVGDWSMLLGGFALAGLLVWLL